MLRDRPDWMIEVVFDYGKGHYRQLPEEAGGRQFVESGITGQEPWPVRLAPLSSYRAGLEVRTYSLCRSVLMFHHFPNELGAENHLVRATRPVYDERPMKSVMTGVVQSGYLRQENGTYLERALPPVEFEYRRVQM